MNTTIKVGQKYRTLVENFQAKVSLTEIGQEFTIHKIDNDGDGWSSDVEFKGVAGIWCVLCPSEVDYGRVELVED
jgi:hypothetical protein